MKMNSDIEKMLKDVVKRVPASRPLLQCVHFENGDAVVTDSHRLIKVKDIAPKDLKLDLNLADFSFPDVEYPDTNRLIPSSFSTTLVLDKLRVVEMLPYLKAMAKGYSDKRRIIRLETSDTNLRISRSDRKSQGSQVLNIKPRRASGSAVGISCDSQFLAEALEALTNIKDTRILTLTMKFNSKLTPFLISAGNVDYLVTPVKAF